MIKTTIVDTGVIVAALNKREKYHAWTLKQMRSLNVPMLTCEAVITEASYLMQGELNGKEAVLLTNIFPKSKQMINWLLNHD